MSIAQTSGDTGKGQIHKVVDSEEHYSLQSSNTINLRTKWRHQQFNDTRRSKLLVFDGSWYMQQGSIEILRHKCYMWIICYLWTAALLSCFGGLDAEFTCAMKRCLEIPVKVNIWLYHFVHRCLTAFGPFTSVSEYPSVCSLSGTSFVTFKHWRGTSCPVELTGMFYYAGYGSDDHRHNVSLVYLFVCLYACPTNFTLARNFWFIQGTEVIFDIWRNWHWSRLHQLRMFCYLDLHHSTNISCVCVFLELDLHKGKCSGEVVHVIHERFSTLELLNCVMTQNDCHASNVTTRTGDTTLSYLKAHV